MSKEEEKTTENCVTVSGAKIVDILKHPEKAYDVIQEFCNDVSTLTDSMKNLYEQNPVELSILGVQVEVIVKSQAIGKVLLHQEFGCRDDIHEVLAHPITKEVER